MRIRVEHEEAVETQEGKPVDDLGPLPSERRGGVERLLPALPFHEFHGEDAGARVVREHARHANDRVAFVQPPEELLVLGLQCVVELLPDALAELVGHRSKIRARRQAAEHALAEPKDRGEQLAVTQVALDRVGDTGVLDLDDDARTVRQQRFVYLADRRSGERLRREPCKDFLGRSAELRNDDFVQHLGIHGRCVLQQHLEGTLVHLSVTFRYRVDLDVRKNLSDLHHGALHAAEHLGVPLGISRVELDELLGFALRTGTERCDCRSGAADGHTGAELRRPKRTTQAARTYAPIVLRIPPFGRHDVSPPMSSTHPSRNRSSSIPAGAKPRTLSLARYAKIALSAAVATASTSAQEALPASTCERSHSENSAYAGSISRMRALRMIAGNLSASLMMMRSRSRSEPSSMSTKRPRIASSAL